jgi:hypothetical protein
MEREYGVVLSSRSGKVMIRVTAAGTREARKAVQAEIPAWRIGTGGQIYTGSYTTRIDDFAPAYRAQFIPLSEAVSIIARDGSINMERAA